MIKDDKQKFIAERIKTEEGLASVEKDGIREAVLKYLKEDKGYSDEDIEIDKRFEVPSDGGKTETACTDFIVKIDGRRLIAIKCTPTALESRERHMLAFSRVVDDCLIPYSVVTNGIHARVLETSTGRLIAEDPGSIPSKAELASRSIEPCKCPPERAEKEKRILLAFESIACSIIYR